MSESSIGRIVMSAILAALIIINFAEPLKALMNAID
jgi:hypothetical protein